MDPSAPKPLDSNDRRGISDVLPQWFDFMGVFNEEKMRNESTVRRMFVSLCRVQLGIAVARVLLAVVSPEQRDWMVGLSWIQAILLILMILYGWNAVKCQNAAGISNFALWSVTRILYVLVYAVGVYQADEDSTSQSTKSVVNIIAIVCSLLHVRLALVLNQQRRPDNVVNTWVRPSVEPTEESSKAEHVGEVSFSGDPALDQQIREAELTMQAVRLGSLYGTRPRTAPDLGGSAAGVRIHASATTPDFFSRPAHGDIDLRRHSQLVQGLPPPDTMSEALYDVRQKLRPASAGSLRSPHPFEGLPVDRGSITFLRSESGSLIRASMASPPAGGLPSIPQPSGESIREPFPPTTVQFPHDRPGPAM